MDDDKLKKGQELKEQIEKDETQKRRWENVKSISTLTVNWIYDQNKGFTTTDHVNTLDVNLDVLKALTIDTLTKRIFQLKKQYAEL